MSRLTETDIRERFSIDGPCCDSCHDDMDHGYPAFVLEIDGQEVQVCCRVSRAMRERELAMVEAKQGEREGVMNDTPKSRHEQIGKIIGDIEQTACTLFVEYKRGQIAVPEFTEEKIVRMLTHVSDELELLRRIFTV